MGDLAFYPGNPERIFLATGDPQISSFPRIGKGVYRSLDGGDNWENMGLDSMGVISKLLFVPGTEDGAPVLFAGAMGNPAQPNEYRGLFRSEDAGVSWSQVLLPDDSAGVTDMLYDPDTEAVYAQRGSVHAIQRVATCGARTAESGNQTTPASIGKHCPILGEKEAVDGLA